MLLHAGGIQILSEIPIDIAQLIVETAASTDLSRRTALSLSLVSHEIQSWADKYLFRSIIIQNDVVRPTMVAFMESFTSTDPTPRFRKARNYVRYIATKQGAEGDLLLRFVKVCSYLHSLALWAMPLHPGFPAESCSYLRRLTFGKSTADEAFSFSSALFCAVTHLELVAYSASQWPSLWESGLAGMTTLTHLVLDATEVRHSPIPLLYDLSANMPPNLRVLLLFVDARQTPSSNGHLYDDRIVLASRTTSRTELPYIDLCWRAWTGEIEEEETLWAKAEMVLELSRARGHND